MTDVVSSPIDVLFYVIQFDNRAYNSAECNGDDATFAEARRYASYHDAWDASVSMLDVRMILPVTRQLLSAYDQRSTHPELFNAIFLECEQDALRMTMYVADQDPDDK